MTEALGMMVKPVPAKSEHRDFALQRESVRAGPATAPAETGYLTIEEVLSRDLPSTRYQGSKRRLASWLFRHLGQLRFSSALDAFGGTGSVSYILKLMGKRVVFNDCLQANYQTGLAFIVNGGTTLDKEDVDWLLQRHENAEYRDTIAGNFAGVFYKDFENEWLDMMAGNIPALSERHSGEELKFKKAIAYWCLAQSCLMKRPFNLFHRANLNLRTNDVPRKFGNATTWERPFPVLFRQFADEAREHVFSNGQSNVALCSNVSELLVQDVDLVYLDPPYIPVKARVGKGQPRAHDYASLYHFLDGLVSYRGWAPWQNEDSPTLAPPPNAGVWSTPDGFLASLQVLVESYPKASFVLSYKRPGSPCTDTLKRVFRSAKREVSSVSIHHNYALNRNNGNGRYFREVLLIAESRKRG